MFGLQQVRELSLPFPHQSVCAPPILMCDRSEQGEPLLDAMDVLPISPVPMRAIGARFSVKLMIPSISSSRPKQALGARGGYSPGMPDASIRDCIC